MKVTQQQFLNRVQSILDASDRHERLSVSSLTRAALRFYDPDYEANLDGYFLNCVWTNSRRAVVRYMTLHGSSESKQTQLDLPEVEHLQKFYVVGHGEEADVVPLESLTAQELNFLALRLRSESETKAAHALELERYKFAKYGDDEQARAVS